MLDPTPLTEELTARHSTPCGLCTSRIVKGRSRIVGIQATEPVVVQLDGEGWPVFPRVHSFVHAACAARYAEETDDA